MPRSLRVALPLLLGSLLFAVWMALTWPLPQLQPPVQEPDREPATALAQRERRILPSSLFPSPSEVAAGMLQEIRSGRLARDGVASLFRVGVGFGGAILLGVPIGLWLGHSAWARAALLPFINFLRALSPLAWIPFAIFWFGVGDAPAIFLIFGATLFPLIVSTLAAVAAIPEVYFRVARENGCRGLALLQQVTFPAILPSLVTALRVGAGLAWLVVVAAEMVNGRDGLGFLVWDARNGLRADLLVVAMIVIGTIGIVLDMALSALTRLPEVRWGYDN